MDKPLKRWVKGIPFDVKGVDESARTFSGLAAAWSLDLGNDVIHKGAFKRTLNNWRGRKGKNPIYLLNGHSAYDVQDVVGKMVEADENDEGLQTEWQFVEQGDPAADAAYTRVKGGFVTGMSIGYTPVEWDMENDGNGKMIRHLKAVHLHEVSLVVFPMNEDARVDTASVKQMLDLGLTDDLKEMLVSLPDAEKQELRVLLAAAEHSPAPASEALQTSIRERLLRIKSRQLVTRAARLGLTPGDHSQIPEVSHHAEDRGAA